MSPDELSSPPSHKKLLAILAIGAFFVIGSQLYITAVNSHLNLHNKLKDLAISLELNMSLAHLWLEESLNKGGEHEEAKIEPLFESISIAFQELKEIQQHKHIFLSHPEIETLPSLIQKTEAIALQLRQSAVYRLANRTESGIGSKADESFDLQFKAFTHQVTRIQSALNSSRHKHLSNLHTLEVIATTIAIFVSLVGAALIFSFLSRQKHHYEQRLRAAKQQKSSEQRYRALIEQSPFAIQVLKTDGSILSVNNAWEKLWRTSPDKLVDYNILNDKLVQESDIFEDLKQGVSGEPVITKVVNFNPSAKKTNTSPFGNRFVRIHIYPVLNVDDEIDNIVMLFTDYTDNHLQHTFQLGQAQLLKEIANPNIPLNTVLTDLINFVETIKPNAQVLILFTNDEKQSLEDGISSKLDQAYLKSIDGLPIGNNIATCGSAAFAKKLVITNNIEQDSSWEKYKDLALRFGLQSCWSQPIMDSEQHVLGTFAMYFDSPQLPSDDDLDLIKRASHLARNAIIHKRSMRALLASQNALKEAQKMAHLGSWEYDLLNNKVTWSDEKYDIFGADKTTFQPSYEAFMSRVHPDDRNKVDQAYAEAVKSKQPFDQKFRLLLPCNTVKYVHDKCKTFYDDHGTPYKSVGTTQDITRIIEEEKERKQHQEKMEHVQRLESLGVLAGGIAHDFNNILTAILGNAELARIKIDTSSQAQHYIKHITQASQKAANLCRQMLAYSGKGQFIIQATNLSDLVVEMNQLLSVTLPKNVVLRLDLSKQLPAIDADVTQLQQVIMNLVINASEAIGEHSGAISIATGVVRIDQDYLATTFVDEELKEGLYVYLEVSDTGCGMDDETHARIFEPFFTTKFTGRGLGMAAILGIVRGHEGAIKSYSELGKGTTFKLFFPQSSENASPLPSAQTKALGWRSNGCVLIVDDEETIREVGTDMLIDLGLSVKQASDGLQAIEVYKEYKHEIHVVILDMTMPHMGGEDTYVELCRINPDVQVILSSGYNEQDTTNRFAGKGLAGFLQKPYTSDELATQLSKILNKT